jgi:predicted ribosome quality control (RQC) complex YloA/Tae2 family protein
MAVGLDSFAVTFLAKELKGLLAGYAIGSVSLKDDKVLFLHLEGERPLNLVFMAEPTLPLLCVSESLGRGKDLRHPPRLEEPLKGCVLTDVCQIELDRILLLTLEPVTRGLLRLYFELVPPFPNMFLTDGDDTILEPLFKAGTRTRRRVLDRRDTYSTPPPPDKIHPADLTPELCESLDWQEDPDILSRRITGVSPFLSRELAARAERRGSLYEVFSAMLADYRKAKASPCLFEIGPPLSKTPPHLGLAWLKPMMEDANRVEPKTALNECVEKLITAYLAVGSLETTRAKALRALTKQTRKWEKARERAAEALRKRKEAERLRKFGEIIVANMGKIKRGTREARLPDIYDADQREMAIPLEPKLSPQANAEVYFKRAKKTLRRADRAAEQLKTAEARLRALRHLKADVESPDTSEHRMGEVVEALRQEPAEKRKTETPVDEKAERLGIRPRRYIVPGGWTVLVGRSARENDVLTHRYAAPSDLWFHARQAQGSHVVLRRLKKKTQVPREAILQAAAIAAYYSKARTSKHVPVSYTEKRYVKKVKKGGPGTAAMLREKVVFVTPSLP